ncbi:MAG: alpha/beta hydrolase [Granulosicoccus sp.]
MMAELYFNQGSRKTTRWLFTRFASRLLRLYCPKLATRLLCHCLSPKPKTRTVYPPGHFNNTRLETPQGDLQVYRVGCGPVVLFLHGWFGSGAQFFPLMQQVADAGYCAVSFDQYCHGESQGSECNLPLLMEATQIVINKLHLQERLVATVSHSVGSVLALNSDLDHKTDHFMIAPLFDLLPQFKERMDKAGIDPELFTLAISHIENQHDFSFNQLNDCARFAELTSRVHIIHNSGDRIAPINASRSMANRFSLVTLEEIAEKSHTRIIGASSTEQALINFLNSNQIH